MYITLKTNCLIIITLALIVLSQKYHEISQPTPDTQTDRHDDTQADGVYIVACRSYKKKKKEKQKKNKIKMSALHSYWQRLVLGLPKKHQCQCEVHQGIL